MRRTAPGTRAGLLALGLLVAVPLATGAAHAAPAADEAPGTPVARVAADVRTETAGPLREAFQYTFRTFPRRAVEIGVELFTGRSLVVLALAGASVPLFAAHLDGDVKAEADRHPRQQAYVDASSIAGSTGTLLLLSAAVAVGGRLAGSGETVRTGTTLLEALTVDGLLNDALKLSTHRLRPDRSDHLSFPSGHASASFTAATVLAGRYGWRLGAPAYAAAAGIGLSRIDADRHFLSDVLFGAALGTVIGLSALEVRDREAARWSAAPATLGTLPLPGADPTGLAWGAAGDGTAGRRWAVSPLAAPGGVALGVVRSW